MTEEAILTFERTELRDASRDLGVRTILLHIQNDQALDCRIECALSLARASSAHLHCVQITPMQAYVAFDTFGGVFVMSDVIKAIDDEEARLRARVEERLHDEDVAWDYQQVTGNVGAEVVRFGALADLIVTGRDAHTRGPVAANAGILGDILVNSRTPLLIPADQPRAPIDPFGTAIIAWDGSFEAANAVRAALGLLKLSANVRIVRISEDGKDEGFPGTRLPEFLSRHGIHADLHLETAGGGGSGAEIGQRLIDAAVSANAAYLVMGGYGHSRMGEWLFGGVTHDLLRKCEVPLVVAH